MPATPDEIRAGMLRCKLTRTLVNVARWWGASSHQAAEVLAAMRDELCRTGRIGPVAWPDPREARFNPGMTDAELREMAHRAIADLSANGVQPSGRNVWRWCRAHGARKRDRDAVRIIRGVISVLSARAAGAAYVRRE